MSDRALREHVVNLLRSRGAHADFEAAVAGLPPELQGGRAPGIPYTAWQLLEHLRIAQWDILEFSRRADHVSPSWPEGYWPPTGSPPDEEAWDRGVRAFLGDRSAIEALVDDTSTDLFTPLAHGDGQTILREALLVADHNAYHIGQLVLLRRALGAWPAG